MAHKIVYNGQEVDRLPPEFAAIASKRLSTVLSAYYASRPEELKKLIKAKGEVK